MRRKTILYMLGALVLALLVVGVGVTFYLSNAKEEAELTAGVKPPRTTQPTAGPDPSVEPERPEGSDEILSSADGNQTAGPDNLAEPASPEEEEILRQLREVPAHFNVPERLPYSQSIEIRFVLDTTGAGPAVTGVDRAPGETQSVTVLASDSVRAKLTGPDDLVTIKLRGVDQNEKRTVTKIAPVTWVWDVKAIGTGSVTLDLELFAEVKRADSTVPLQIKTFSKEIPIEISIWHSVKLWLSELSPVSTALTGLGGLLAAILTYFGIKPLATRRRQKIGVQGVQPQPLQQDPG